MQTSSLREPLYWQRTNTGESVKEQGQAEQVAIGIGCVNVKFKRDARVARAQRRQVRQLVLEQYFLARAKFA